MGEKGKREKSGGRKNVMEEEREKKHKIEGFL